MYIVSNINNNWYRNTAINYYNVIESDNYYVNMNKNRSSV